MPGEGVIWPLVALATHMSGALAALFAAMWIGRRRDRYGPVGTVIVASLFLTALWCLTVAVTGSYRDAVHPGEAIRNLGWLWVVYRLFSSDGRDSAVSPIKLVVLALGFVELCHMGLEVLAWRLADTGGDEKIIFDLAVLFRLLASVGGLVLVHNLYTGAAAQSRSALRWPAAGLGVLLAFDLNLYTIAYLDAGWPVELAAMRGLSVVALAALLALGVSKDRDVLRLRPSRTVTFQTASLILIGGYFLTMFGIAQGIAYVGGALAPVLEFGFLIVASTFALFVLPSRRLRGWLRVTVSKHLFQHRYDYRAEWLRFTRTIGSGGAESQPLEQRVVQAVADIAESPAGMLLAPDDNGELTLAARWQWASVEVPAMAMPVQAVTFFEKDGFILDLDDIRAGRDHRGETAIVPDWLRQEPRAWALVPLIHYERLIGVVVLARPPQVRKFDWEDFDLLRVVGQQLASYLAEHSGQRALEEASRFDDFHRRIAFVMHDIKNLASQLSLLARNAERHADNPAFRDDMLVTLRNSADKLNTLLARLSRYGGNVVDRLADVDADKVAVAVVERFIGQHPVHIAEMQPCCVAANRESLEQVLVHLVQNAVDASAPDSPVFIGLTNDGMHGRFEILDSGCGMSPEFIRTRLFKPFVSSKPGGFGIGAFEARELARAMRGRLEVESREGLGTRFIVRLPLAEASGLLKTFELGEQKVA
jgi:putative PEP-CTERM system histidine kinase